MQQTPPEIPAAFSFCISPGEMFAFENDLRACMVPPENP
jgi:hypothetical protein